MSLVSYWTLPASSNSWKRACSVLLLSTLTAICSTGQTVASFTISTVAGNGTVGYSGDGGPATKAAFNGPWGVAADSAGNLYIPDFYNNRVRKVAPDGTITTVAGTGAAGFSGDGGPATKATLNSPDRVTVDAAGNLYIADIGNLRVRKVSPDGTITTVAGNGNAGSSGDGGPATSAAILGPEYLLVDSAGDLFISCNEGSFPSAGVVRKVMPNGIITTIAGNGIQAYSGDGGPAISASLNTPRGLAFDATGNLFIADQGNNRIRKISNGIIMTVAGNGVAGYTGDGGPAINAELSGPTGISFDATGNLYIADPGNNRIRVLLPNGTISTVAGNGTAGYSGDGDLAISAALQGPKDVSVSAGVVYIADTSNQRVRLLTPVVPKPVVTSFVNDATFSTGVISAGSWVAVFGTGLAVPGDSRLWNTTTEIVNGKFPTSLDGTSVAVNGKPAFVEFISPTQVNIQPPDDTAVGPVQVVVTTAAGMSNSFTANYATFAPGLFPATAPYVVVQHADNSYVTPTSPAQPGEVIVLWGTGFGPAIPTVPAGQVFSGVNPLANNVTVTIGGQQAAVDFAGIVGAGLVQINVHVPLGINNGDAAVVATVGGVSTQTSANLISIHN